ncbi:hypothetical protein, partial [Kitasatospora sp. MBT66]|uniref:hypothetical protein n=1 Tax=Kitasatospora sp. MBT66 TaxID=1444769 RepID=UPI0005B98370
MTRTRTARLTGDRLDAAAAFLWTSGRILEQRRFAHLFGGESNPDGDPSSDPGGDPAGVLAALDAHRTADGGYAYGLEPDVRGPAAQPITVPGALLVLEEIGALDAARARAVCDWLAGVAAPDGGVPVVLPSLRPYPHPPFVPVPEEDEPPVGALLSTGQIVAPLLRRGIVHPWLTAATAFCRTAVENLQGTHPYEAGAAIRFLDAAPDTAWARREAARLGALVHEQRIVLLDPTRPEDARISPGYAPGEYHLPHDYARRPNSLARRWFTAAELARGLDHLAAEQQ